MAPLENNPLVGTWKLLRFEFKAEDGRTKYPFGKEARGSFIYTACGHFSGQLMSIDRPKFQIPDQMRGTTDEILTSYKGAISYFGTYQVNAEKGFIIHFVEGSIFPNMEGTQQVRYFDLKENTLQLRTPPFKADGEAVIGTILWERVE